MGGSGTALSVVPNLAIGVCLFLLVVGLPRLGNGSASLVPGCSRRVAQKSLCHEQWRCPAAFGWGCLRRRVGRSCPSPRDGRWVYPAGAVGSPAPKPTRTEPPRHWAHQLLQPAGSSSSRGDAGADPVQPGSVCACPGASAGRKAAVSPVLPSAHASSILPGVQGAGRGVRDCRSQRRGGAGALRAGCGPLGLSHPTFPSLRRLLCGSGQQRKSSLET